jgi:hypothetical protein
MFLDTTYQNGENIPNGHKILIAGLPDFLDTTYQKGRNTCIPNGHKILIAGLPYFS